MPTLTNLAKAGDDLAYATKALLTYPFSDGFVGNTYAKASGKCVDGRPAGSDKEGACFGDFANLSLGLDIGADSGDELLDGYASQAGYRRHVATGPRPPTRRPGPGRPGHGPRARTGRCGLGAADAGTGYESGERRTSPSATRLRRAARLLLAARHVPHGGRQRAGQRSRTTPRGTGGGAMISRLTKIQLIIFAIVTVLGGAFVGGRYAQIDRLVVDRSFPVAAQFKDSGGIFAGAQVTYRGIPVGKVGKLEFKDNGVQATLDIENSAPKISPTSRGRRQQVGDRRAVRRPAAAYATPALPRKGFVDRAPNTRIPIDTTTLLVDINDLVSSVNTDSLRTVVDELGQAFEGTGQDLSTILDTSSEFIKAADENIDVTRSLINDSDSVLQTQIDKQGELEHVLQEPRTVVRQLVDADPDLRRLLDKGSVSARTLREVVDENSERSGQGRSTIWSPPTGHCRRTCWAFRRSSSSTPTSSRARSRCSPATNNGTKTGDYNAAFGLVMTGARRPTCTYDAERRRGFGLPQASRRGDHQRPGVRYGHWTVRSSPTTSRDSPPRPSSSVRPCRRRSGGDGHARERTPGSGSCSARQHSDRTGPSRSRVIALLVVTTASAWCSRRSAAFSFSSSAETTVTRRTANR